RSEPRQQPVTTKQQIAVEQQVKPTRRFGDSRFDPYSIGMPRRLGRRERLQLYYGGSAQLPPPGYYRAAPPPQAYRRYYDARYAHGGALPDPCFSQTAGVRSTTWL